MNVVPSLRNCVNDMWHGKCRIPTPVLTAANIQAKKKKVASACSSWSTKYLGHKAVLQQSHKRVEQKQMLKTLLFARSSGGECTEKLSRNNTILQYSSSPACLQ